MKLTLFCFLFLFVQFSWAIPCDCEVRVYSPLTGSHQMKPTVLKSYPLEEFSSVSVKNQQECRNNCLTTFEKDMPGERLVALLSSTTERFIEEGVLGFNCSGLTTVKYPVRVKAFLGDMGLGNVSETIVVVTREEICPRK